MLLLAASTILGMALSGAGDLNERELRAWKKVQPSVVMILDGQMVSGTAALIDRKGLFLAHRTAVRNKSIEGRLSDGSIVKLDWIATDEPTQFVLLETKDWKSDIAPLTAIDSDASKSLLALTPTGPVRAERFGDTYGLMNPSKRVMPLNEIRLENNLPSLGGALVIDLDGKLAGAINAALELTPAQNATKSRGMDQQLQGGPGSGGFGGGGGARADSKTVYQNSQFGPGVMTTAYTIGPKIIRRVVSGFLSEDHIVRHPAIGIFCKDGFPQGALIESVTKGSKADSAGLMKGDIITSIKIRQFALRWTSPGS